MGKKKERGARSEERGEILGCKGREGYFCLILGGEGFVDGR